MTTMQLLHPEIGFRHTGLRVRALGSIELLLLVAAICTLILAAGVWTRSTIAGPVRPVMASITVQPGDTLWSLAKQYGDPNQYILERVHTLAKANSLQRGDALHVGQTLVIPVTNRSAKLYYGGHICKRIDQEPDH
jgi:hypothetical protein